LSPVGDKPPCPAHETHYRELLGLTPEQTVKAWENAVTAAGGKPLTAKMVHEAAAAFKPAKKARKKSSAPSIDIGPGKFKDGAADWIFASNIPVVPRMSILVTEADIDAYLAALKKAYMKEIRKHKCIRLI
jgi:hypothetical protein